MAQAGNGQSGNVQDEMALVGKYKAGFTGKVPTEFSQPSAFEIKPKYTGEQGDAYGYCKQESHPTPTAPGDGTI